MPGESKTTTSHEKIKKWAEARGGKPATVKGTGNGEPGLLRIDFPGYRGKHSLEPISWEEFFAKFEEKNLAFLYQEKTATGKPSRFFKLVSRDTARAKTSRKKAGETAADRKTKPSRQSEPAAPESHTRRGRNDTGTKSGTGHRTAKGKARGKA